MREEVRVLCVKSAGLGREHFMPTRVFSFGLKGISKRRGTPTPLKRSNAHDRRYAAS